MKTKRILTIEKKLDRTLAEEVFILDELISSSQGIELFESEVFVYKSNDILKVGLSIIGIDGELFAHKEKLDFQVIESSEKKYPFFGFTKFVEKLKNNEMVSVNREFEFFRPMKFQIISD